MSGKHTKKRITIIVILALAPIIAFFAFFVPGRPILFVWDNKEYTRDELEQVFNENKEQFQLVAGIVAKNEKFAEKSLKWVLEISIFKYTPIQYTFQRRSGKA